MKCRFLIDTMVFIDHFNSNKKATAWLSSIKEGEAAISVITLAEVLVGISPQEEDEIYLLMDNYTCLGISAATAKLAADLRRQHKWKLPDAFQAALAIEHQLLLMTRNTKDFSPKSHPFVTIPYS